ncbi:MAG: hypothetical protein OXR66_03900 [Candidatus Woesearchaeota archaeon]|nr:hypothetical protein [Candidatus Woesearchaeota archaeon]
MPKRKTLKDVARQCEIEGMFLSVQVNKQRILDIVRNADIKRSGADKLASILKPQDLEWMNVYVDYYEALRMYVEALLFAAGCKIMNHQCLFAYLCTKHSFPWRFLDDMRRKRNQIHYYGKQITYQDWNDIEQQVKELIEQIKMKLE